MTLLLPLVLLTVCATHRGALVRRGRRTGCHPTSWPPLSDRAARSSRRAVAVGAVLVATGAVVVLAGVLTGFGPVPGVTLALVGVDLVALVLVLRLGQGAPPAHGQVTRLDHPLGEQTRAEVLDLAGQDVVQGAEELLAEAAARAAHPSARPFEDTPPRRPER